jgi:hypothetical protein
VPTVVCYLRNITGGSHMDDHQLSADKRFSDACDRLSEAEAAYRTDKSARCHLALLAAQRAFNAAKADRGDPPTQNRDSYMPRRD